MSMAARRAVVVYRPTDYQLLIAHHGTRGQVEFYLRSRAISIEDVEAEDVLIHESIAHVLAAIPPRWRRASISRDELSRFLFEPEDVVIAVGQDGLVANVAKYLSGQLVVGMNPLPQRFDGLLVRHPIASARDLLAAIDVGQELRVQSRTMVRAELEDGQTLVALNEIFVGHKSHQSARYRIALDGRSERHSSSGLICCTGTGSTGWGSSVHHATGSALTLPAPTDTNLCFFVREAWPSKTTQASLVAGVLTATSALTLTSEMNQGGVVFGDGIEDDFLPFDWGNVAHIGLAKEKLRLV